MQNKTKYNIKNKIIILVVFLIIVFIIIFKNKPNNNKKEPISEKEAMEKISNIFDDNNLEKIENKSLVLTKNDDYMIMVVENQYILTDFSTYPPKTHHYKSNKPDIKVKVIEIREDSYVVEHDDHSHIIYEKLDDNIKVGDFVYIKDPHTYLQDYFDNKNKN